MTSDDVEPQTVPAPSGAKPSRALSGELIFRALLILVGCVGLAWPAIVNGDGFYLSDTTTYIRGADAGFYRKLGVTSDWSDEISRVAKAEPIGAGRTNHEKNADVQFIANEETARVVLAGRSVYYGLLLYLSYLAGDFTLVIALQALLVGVASALTLIDVRRLSGSGAGRFEVFGLLMALSLLTPIGFFVAYLMPDIFAGLAVLSIANLLALRKVQSRSRRLFWLALLTCSLLMHSANVIITTALLTAFVLASSVLRQRWDRRAVGLVVVAIVAAIGGEALFNLTVRASTGFAPVRPPFLTARLIADGPGRTYIKQHCPQSGFVLCRLPGQLPDNSDMFLWGDRPGDLTFSNSTPAIQRLLAAEQLPFTGAVFAADPLGVLRGFVVASADQASSLSLSEFNYDAGLRSSLEKKVPPRPLARLRASRAFDAEMPVELTKVLSLITLVVALCYCGWWMFRGAKGEMKGARTFVLLLLAAVAIDILVCGSLSTPHDRYLMRVIWLIPLAAFCVLPARSPQHHAELA